jgi:hypothetical protein
MGSMHICISIIYIYIYIYSLLLYMYVYFFVVFRLTVKYWYVCLWVGRGLSHVISGCKPIGIVD